MKEILIMTTPMYECQKHGKFNGCLSISYEDVNSDLVRVDYCPSCYIEKLDEIGVTRVSRKDVIEQPS